MIGKINDLLKAVIVEEYLLFGEDYDSTRKIHLLWTETLILRWRRFL